MALLSRLYTREATASFGRGGTLTSCLEHIAEDFRCYNFDQHLIEGTELEIIPPFACSFCKVPGSLHILAVADEDGTVVLYNLNKTGDNCIIKDWNAHSNAIFDLNWIKGENKLLTASGDQTIAMWDAETSQKINIFRGHTSSVKSISSRWNDPYIFSSGSRDGHIMLWDTRCSKKDGFIPSINTIRNAHLTPSGGGTTPKPRKRTRLGPPQDSQQSVTCVVFQDEHHLVSAGAVDGTVKVWDMRKNYTILKTEAQSMCSFPYSGSSIRKHGFSNLTFDSSRTKLFASCTDDHIYQYNCASYTQEPEYSYKGHRNSTFYVKACVSPDDRFLMSGSSDNNAYIWKVGAQNSSPLLLKGHVGEVTGVAWDPADFTKAVTLSDDSTVRVWRLWRHRTPESDRATIGYAERATIIKDSPVKTSISTGTLTSRRSPQKYVKTVPNSSSSTNQNTLSGAVIHANQNTMSVTANLSNTRNMTAKLVPATLAHWLKKTGNKVDKSLLTSPRKLPPPSPRKLIISPRKVMRVQTPVRGDLKRQHSSGHLTQRNKMAKIERNDQKLENGNVLDEVRYNSPEKRDSSIGDLEVSEQWKTPGKAKKNLFSADFKGGGSVQRLKTIESSLALSPTSNLPNWVLNPEPRVPQAPQNKENSPKSVDWLTKISLQRRSSVNSDISDTSKKTISDNSCGKLRLKVKKDRILSKDDKLEVDKGSPKSVSRPASPTSPMVASPRNRSILSFFKLKPKQ